MIPSIVFHGPLTPPLKALEKVHPGRPSALQRLVSQFQPPIGSPAHQGQFRREVLALERASAIAHALPETICAIDGSLVRRLARGGIHQAVALPASEIAPTKDPAAAAPTLEARAPLTEAADR